LHVPVAANAPLDAVPQNINAKVNSVIRIILSPSRHDKS
jgi:hypothetical protein